MAWALFFGLVHILLDGTYMVFHHLLGERNKAMPWFVVMWHKWGLIDSRYRRSDPFIIVQVGAMAIVAGPAQHFRVPTLIRIPKNSGRHYFEKTREKWVHHWGCE